ncbi:MAG TPA: Glu/Leu/Phe/Val dehydrogenase dimerization domain-containing protein [Novosphingobium sp.]
MSQTVEREAIHHIEDEASGLSAAIVIHSTALGPAAGGCRLWAYDSAEAMIADGCRLAEGMTYKNALAGLPLGGGKAVISRPRGEFDRTALFRAFGRAVEALHGSYVTAEDVGTSVADMMMVAQATKHVAGLPPEAGRAGGDPSPWTAIGVFRSMEVAVARRLSRPLSECTVALQGAGHVGAELARLLYEAGAKLVITDIDRAVAAGIAARTGAVAVAPDAILDVPTDVFAPCALGGVLNEGTIAQMSAKVVCGAANNQLATPADGVRLAESGILYAPDYVVNAGGIINAGAEHLGWCPDEAQERILGTGRRLADILDHAEANGLTPEQAADHRARQIVAAARQPIGAAV